MQIEAQLLSLTSAGMVVAEIKMNTMLIIGDTLRLEMDPAVLLDLILAQQMRDANGQTTTTPV